MANDEDSADAQAAKSKQARIRDNQRRSRARRQEHLQDLERRLSECHVACREAELQLGAFIDLQAENARLKELLGLVGVSQALVQAFIHQENPKESNATSTLRQIKPKLVLPANVMEVHRRGTSIIPESSKSPSSVSGSVSDSTAGGNSAPGSNAHGYDSASATLTACSPLPNLLAPGIDLTTTTASLSPQSAIATFDQSPNFQTGGPLDAPFWCNVFGVKARSPLLVSNENTVSCTLARDIIDQYNGEGCDFEEVKSRLAAGFTYPNAPGETCRVNSQVLFEVLNDISTRIS